MPKITCFLPCRKGSQRVPRKNVRKFSNMDYGLLEIKVKQLIDVEAIDEIILSTNDGEIIDWVQRRECKKIRVHTRCDQLSSSVTSTDELVMHAKSLISDGCILWTHVTSPFVNAKVYTELIDKYLMVSEQGYDSLMTTTKVCSFLWNKKGPINYDRNREKWPRTQTLEGVYEINSAAFIAHANIYEKYQDRIGKNPYLFTLDKLTGYDIDWQDDFIVAECLLEKGLVSI